MHIMKNAAARGIRFADGGEDQEGAAGQAEQENRDYQQPEERRSEEPRLAEPKQHEQPRHQDGEDGFPPNTPLTEMTQSQREAYWKHRARTHEDNWKKVRDRNLTPDQIVEMQDRLDALDRERMTQHEKDVSDAKKAAADAARAELMPAIVLAQIEAAVARRDPGLGADEIRSRTEFLDLTKFLTTKGEVDTDKVSNYAATLAPETQRAKSGEKKFPDMGGGRRGPVNESAKSRAEQIARSRGYIRDPK